jgi:hypothetical protein
MHATVEKLEAAWHCLALRRRVSLSPVTILVLRIDIGEKENAEP